MENNIDEIIDFFTEKKYKTSELIQYEIINRWLNISQVRNRGYVSMSNIDYFHSLDAHHRHNLIKMINRSLAQTDECNFNPELKIISRGADVYSEWLWDSGDYLNG